MDLPFAPFVPTGFDALVGTRITELTPERATAELEVRDQLKQPFGLLHGGVFATVAETLASFATGVEARKAGYNASGLSNQTSFLRPALSGTVYATAVRKHAGRTTWVWEVEFSDAQGRLYALTRMTIALREMRENEPPPEPAR
jgi:1,4-dihydroxy-2-naphthoyl-CoA hydrolase